MNRRLPRWLIGVVSMALLLAFLLSAVAQPARPKTLTREEAFSVFTLLCVRSGIWPAGLDPLTSKRLVVGVLGRDQTLLAALRQVGRKAESEWFKGGDISFVEGSRPEELASCHVIFLGELSDDTRARAVEYFRGRPVLLISSAANFVRTGGIAEVRIVDEKFQFDLNLDALQAAGIELMAKFRAGATGIVIDGRHQPNTNKVVRPNPDGGQR